MAAQCGRNFGTAAAMPVPVRACLRGRSLMRVALYARVSTKQHGQDPETQLLPLREFARQRQLEVAGEYVDLRPRVSIGFLTLCWDVSGFGRPLQGGTPSPLLNDN
jgi:hypothetical protein